MFPFIPICSYKFPEMDTQVLPKIETIAVLGRSVKVGAGYSLLKPY
jgi:hypothetical protein